MSETITASAMGDATLPVEFRVEMFRLEHPGAIHQWKRKEWSVFFDGMPLAQRIELCDAILQEEGAITNELAAYLANATLRCGNSKHVRWDRHFGKTRYANDVGRWFFWRELNMHAELWGREKNHESLRLAIHACYLASM